MIFLGAKFCQHCGAKTDRAEAAAAAKPCPKCRGDLNAITLGATGAGECPRCGGLWVDTVTFNTICADRERQAAVIANVPPSAADAHDFKLADVRYVPCCECGKLMNRVNFAHASGVILDICKAHGVWCDRDELRRIVEFIRAGGLDASRERDREDWEASRRVKEAFNPKSSGGLASIEGEASAGYSGLPGFADVVEVIWSLIARFLK